MSLISFAVQSGAILLREGLEALLVIAALAAFLRKAEAEHTIRSLFIGAGVAVLASIAMAGVIELFLGGAHDDRAEAVVMTIAAVLMIYMSGWLYLKQDTRAWMAELRRSASHALSTGTSWSLGLIAFLAVFREGAETVLFLRALATSAGGWNLGLVLGLVAATALLVALFGAMQWLAVRLPLRPVFLVTSALLFVMGLRFIGGAIQELQEQEIVPVHNANALSDWLIPLGFNASWEAIGVQLAIAALAVASLVAVKMMSRSSAEAVPAAAE